MEFFGKNIIFIQRLNALTISGQLKWKYYSDGMFQFNDEDLKFFHHEFCWVDSSNSFYSKINETIVLLVYEIHESGKDGSTNSFYRLLVAEPGEDGYIDDISIPDEQYHLIAELSYHIKGLLGKKNPKAEKFIDSLIDKTNK